MRSPNFAIILGGILSIPFMLHNQILGTLIWVAVIFLLPYLSTRLAQHRARDHNT